MTKNEIIDGVLKEQRIVKYLPYFKKAMSAAMDKWARVCSKEAIALLRRAYELNKDDMGFDVDVSDFFEKIGETL